MRPSRRTQPLRRVKGAGRAPSTALTNAQRGRSLYGRNPQDLYRLAAKRPRKARRGR